MKMASPDGIDLNMSPPTCLTPAMGGAAATTSGRSKLSPSMMVPTLRMIISRHAPELPPTSTSVPTPSKPPS
uniref:Uncharacterized protein n=1 Tax=Arundo donax TaxID=35708 RepID=A0A0A9CKR3_ARUDO